MSSTPSSPQSDIDLERLREVTGNHQELLQDILDQYLDQAEDILNSIQQSIDGDDDVATRQLAHKLIGSSATCGMTAMIAPLRELEACGGRHPATDRELLQSARSHLGRIRQMRATGLA